MCFSFNLMMKIVQRIIWLHEGGVYGLAEVIVVEIMKLNLLN